MRKFALLALASAVTLAWGTAQAYTPGIYKASAPGMGGPVEVTVEFSKDAITSITVSPNKETPGIGSTAVEQLPDAITKNQSLGVDSISGATRTSSAIKAAVADCVKQAGGDPDALALVPIKKTAGSKKSLETDLLIVGAGGAGQVASIRASQLGKKVILVEKMPFVGGAAAINGGTVVIQGSKLQRELGVLDDSPEIMRQDLLKNGHQKNDLGKLSLYVNGIGPTIDWLHDQVGVKFIPNDLPFLAEYSHRRALEFQGGAGTMAQHLREVIGSNGAKVLFNTRVEKLIVEDGKVTGVEAVDGNTGTKYTIRAKKTLLTTGGYGNNKNLLTDTYKNTLYYGPVSSTGDGLQMAQKLGVKTQLLEYGKRYPNGIEVAPGKAKSTIYANVGAFDQAGILVSRDGLRFVNEKASNRHILDPMLQQKGGMAYVFMDQKSWEGFYKRLPETGVSHEDADKYLAANGKSAPIFVKGATLEEAAKLTGINAENLKATVAKYNSFVKAQKDADFGRPVQYMKAEIAAQGPYYIVEQKPRFATTMGGVCTDDHLNLIQSNGKVIPNLYGAGELVGGVMGDDSPAGANVGWALTSEAIKAGK